MMRQLTVFFSQDINLYIHSRVKAVEASVLLYQTVEGKSLSFTYKACCFHISEEAGGAYFHLLSHTQSKGLALREPRWLPSIVKHIDGQTSWTGFHEKWMAGAFLFSMSWHYYTRCIKWVNRQWKITHAQTVTNCNLAPRRKIHHEKNDVDRWSCAVPPVWPLSVTVYDSIM